MRLHSGEVIYVAVNYVKLQKQKQVRMQPSTSKDLTSSLLGKGFLTKIVAFIQQTDVPELDFPVCLGFPFSLSV